MNKVYLLQHCYEQYDDYGESEEVKLIGVFSDMEIVNKIIDEYIDLPGFDLFERDAFIVDEYELDKEYWSEGFFENDGIFIPIGNKSLSYPNVKGPNSENNELRRFKEKKA